MTALLRHIAEPGLDVRLLFADVRRDVMLASKGVQRPETWDSLDGRFAFKPAPQQPAAAQPKPPTPSPPQVVAPPPSASEGRAVAQRVVLYEEDPANPQGKRFIGSAIWRTEKLSPAAGQPPELAIRADVEIPERQLAMTWSLRRNTDPTLPASHTVEITFKLPSNFAFGGVSNVPGILMKEAEQSRGMPLAGLAVKVTNGFFLIGLSSVDANKERNMALLKERSWFDIPVVYNNNRRAILALEKGTTGERVFAEAFAAWAAKPSTSIGFLAPVRDPCGVAVSVSFSSRPAVPLCAAEERALKPKDIFKECEQCPEMVMGSPANETGRLENEGPQHRVTFDRPFAVGRFAVTFDEWDACVADGGCRGYRPADNGWGRGRRPVINVSWDDAKAYVAWPSGKTKKSYRLLSEAEREYVTRTGTTTPFWWETSISTTEANYEGNYTYNGSKKGAYREKTEPVDSFAANPWGLYQVHGNVGEWVEDCWHDSYSGAPSDGSAWTAGDCRSRVLRGGAWNDSPGALRAAFRLKSTPGFRGSNLGFRVGRTLN
jgi:hypothetical protein